MTPMRSFRPLNTFIRVGVSVFFFGLGYVSLILRFTLEGIWGAETRLEFAGDTLALGFFFGQVRVLWPARPQTEHFLGIG